MRAQSSGFWSVGLVGIALLLFAIGCRSAPTSRADPTSYMDLPQVLTYSVTVRPDSAEIAMEIRRAKVDVMAFSLPPWNGATLHRDIYGVLATAADNEPLTVHQKTPGFWVVEGIRQRDFTVRYLVVDQREQIAPPTQDRGDVRGLHHPFMNTQQFLAWGHALFLRPTPEFSKGWDDLQVLIKAPESWPIITTWGRPEVSLKHFHELEDALILAGAWKRQETTLAGSLLQFAMAGEDWKVPQEQWHRTLTRILEHQTQVFETYPANSPVLLLLPSATEEITQIVTPGAIVIAAPPDTDPTTNIAFLRSFADAHFRLWSEQLLQPSRRDKDDSYGQLRWLTEGMVAWYAERTLLGLGLVKPEAFLQELNAWIKTYIHHPQAFSSTSEVFATSYAEDPSLHELVRLKGLLLGVLMDIELRAASQGIKTLDHVMRRFFVDAMAKGGTFEQALFQQSLVALGGDGWDTFFTEYIEGATLLPLERLDQGGILVHQRELPVFDLGFEAEGEGFVDKKVTAVLESSSAAKAGLQPGDYIRSMVMGPGQVEEPVRLRVTREGEENPIEIEYKPSRTLPLPVATEMTELFSDWFAP